MISLAKTTDAGNDDINERFAWGMDNEAWNSTVLLPMYLSGIFPSDIAVNIDNGLKINDLHKLAVLLTFEHHYDNVTGKLSV